MTPLHPPLGCDDPGTASPPVRPTRAGQQPVPLPAPLTLAAALRGPSQPEAMVYLDGSQQSYRKATR